MGKVVYKEEDIQMILRLLNNITVKGAQNAKYIAVINDKLSEEGELVSDEDKGGE